MKNEDRSDSNRVHRHSFRMTKQEYDRFLELFEQSGAPTKTKLITGLLSGKPFRVIKTDPVKHKYYEQLCDYYRRVRIYTGNYNRLTMMINRTTDERRMRYLLSELQDESAKLCDVMSKIVSNNDEFKKLWLAESNGGI